MLFDIYIRGSTKNLKEVEQKRVSYSSSEPRLSEDVNHRSVLGYVLFICFIREKLRENYRGKLSVGDKCTCTHLSAQGAQIGVCIAQENTLNAECQ